MIVHIQGGIKNEVPKDYTGKTVTIFRRFPILLEQHHEFFIVSNDLGFLEIRTEEEMQDINKSAGWAVVEEYKLLNEEKRNSDYEVKFDTQYKYPRPPILDKDTRHIIWKEKPQRVHHDISLFSYLQVYTRTGYHPTPKKRVSVQASYQLCGYDLHVHPTNPPDKWVVKNMNMTELTYT